VFKAAESRIMHGYFSRFLLLNTIVFLLVMGLLSFLAFSTVYQKQLENFYRESEKVVAVLIGEMEKKHTSFYQVLFRMYENGGVQGIMDLFAESGALDMQENPALRRQLFEYVDVAVATDDSISMVLFYQREDGRCYVMDRHSRTFSIVDESFPFFSELISKEHLRITMPSRSVVSLGREETGFAIGGNLSSQDFSNPSGYIAVVFSTNAFSFSIQSLGRDLPVEYAIMLSDSDSLVFDSSAEYRNNAHGTETYESVKGNYISTSYYDKFRDYTYLSRVPVSDLLVRSRGTYLLIAGGILAVMIVFMLMFGYTIRTTATRVRELLDGMERLGKNEFSIRLPVHGRSDEFDRLSEHFNLMCGELQNNIQKAYVFELQKNQAELGELQSRVNPHFLSNTIESLRNMLAQKHLAEVDEMMLLLARYYRLMVMGSTFVELSDELDAARLYLDMMSLRYVDRFSYDLEIDGGQEHVGVIRNILQPILENFFQHGFRSNKDDNRLHLQVRRVKQQLFLSVSDNGRGIDIVKLQSLRLLLASDDVVMSKGYGLASVSGRLRLVYGQQAEMLIDSLPDDGFKAVLRFSAEDVDSLVSRMNVAGKIQARM